jgi:hypothetical protein
VWANLSNNQISGPLPGDWGRSAGSLQVLSVRGNKITGGERALVRGSRPCGGGHVGDGVDRLSNIGSRPTHPHATLLYVTHLTPPPTPAPPPDLDATNWKMQYMEMLDLSDNLITGEALCGLPDCPWHLDPGLPAD